MFHVHSCLMFVFPFLSCELKVFHAHFHVYFVHSMPIVRISMSTVCIFMFITNILSLYTSIPNISISITNISRLSPILGALSQIQLPNNITIQIFLVCHHFRLKTKYFKSFQVYHTHFLSIFQYLSPVSLVFFKSVTND